MRIAHLCGGSRGGRSSSYRWQPGQIGRHGVAAGVYFGIVPPNLLAPVWASLPNLMSLILVVDDHYPMRIALEELLKQMGHEVVGAANGKEALVLQRQRSAHVLLTDIFMPEMDGFEVIQKFREQFPTVNVIAMTGGMPRNPGGPYLDIAQKFGAKWVCPSRSRPCNSPRPSAPPPASGRRPEDRATSLIGMREGLYARIGRLSWKTPTSKQIPIPRFEFPCWSLFGS